MLVGLLVPIPTSPALSTISASAGSLSAASRLLELIPETLIVVPSIVIPVQAV